MKLPIKFYKFISNIDYFSEIHKYHKHENNEDMIIDYMISNLAFLLTPSNFNQRASYCFNNWFSILLEIDPIKYGWVKKVDLQFLNNTSVTKQQIIDWEVLNFTGKNRIFTVKREKRTPDLIVQGIFDYLHNQIEIAFKVFNNLKL